MKSLNPKPKSSAERTQELADRLMDFSVGIIKATYGFTKSQSASHISGQLIRSVTSVGANYEEACVAQSRADFIHKLQIALKELREASYWIKLASRLELEIPSNWNALVKENNELVLIFAKSIATSKGVAK